MCETVTVVCFEVESQNKTNERINRSVSADVVPRHMPTSSQGIIYAMRLIPGSFAGTKSAVTLSVKIAMNIFKTSTLS